MTTICILGGSGLLGSSLTPYLRNLGHKVFRISRNAVHSEDVAVDYSNNNSLGDALDSCNPSFVINLAALTNVDVCENNPHLAYAANVQVVESVCKWIQKKGQCHFIQMSTDHIYDGLGPHNEENIKIVNYYAFSKYAGELAASLVPSTIIRTNFFGRSLCSGRDSFSDWVYKSLLKGDNISVFDDVFFSPLSLNTLVQFIQIILSKPVLGTFNLGSKNGLTKADFVYTLAEVFGLSTRNVSRSTLKDRASFASRPSDMRLDCSKFSSLYGLKEIPTLEDEIISIKGDYMNDS